MTEPRTEAGRKLLAWPGSPNDMLTYILAIEAEAAAPPALDAERLRNAFRLVTGQQGDYKAIARKYIQLGGLAARLTDTAPETTDE